MISCFLAIFFGNPDNKILTSNGLLLGKKKMLRAFPLRTEKTLMLRYYTQFGIS